MLGPIKTFIDLHNVTNPTLDNASRRLLSNLKQHRCLRLGFEVEPRKGVPVCVLY